MSTFNPMDKQPITEYRRYLLQAEYADGFIYRPGHEDQSIHNPKRNAFFDIREELHKHHGRLVRFSLISQQGVGTKNYHLDFLKFPDNAKPIYYIKRQRETTVQADGGVVSDVISDTCYGFGYEYTDLAGEVHKSVIEVI